MKIKINNLIIPINERLTKEYVADYLGIATDLIYDFRIIKQSVDARRKSNIRFVCSVTADIIGNPAFRHGIEITELKPMAQRMLCAVKKYNTSPIIVGYGPAGIFCGYILAKYGYNPIIIERGKNVDERAKDVGKFFSGGKLNTESNIQFGEGGAGTFSDGKLTTRINDERCSFVLETLKKFGAPDDILYTAKPHVGTDILKKIVKNIRLETERLGGNILFETRLEDIICKDKIYGIKTNRGDFPCEALVLAIGHSSRDTFKMLFKSGLYYEDKAFAVGVRIEHSQEFINRAQYGVAAGHPDLPAAEYYLKYNGEKRSCYSFCMCPGGEIVPAASEEKTVVTNGMSNHLRNGKYANSGIVVTVSANDFGKGRGIHFQEKLEHKAFILGGENYSAPYQLCGDFFNDKKTTKQAYTTYSRDVNGCRLSEFFPKYICETLSEGLLYFNKKIPGFADKNIPLIGVESRTSSPVRFARGEDLQSVSVRGIYPCGEGAGYAGGIVSAAVDGIKVAEKIMGN